MRPIKAILCVVMMFSCSGKPVAEPTTVVTTPEVAEEEIPPPETSAVEEPAEDQGPPLSERCADDVLVCALEVASTGSEDQKSEWIKAIALAYARAGQYDEMEKLVDRSAMGAADLLSFFPYLPADAIEEILDGIDEKTKQEVLRKGALSMAKAGEVDLANHFLSLMQDGPILEEGYASTAWTLASAGNCAGAMVVIDALEDVGGGYLELRKVQAIAACGEITEAKTTADAIEEPEWRVEALSAVAQKLGKDGDKKATQIIMGEVMALIKGMDMTEHLAEALYKGWIAAGKVKKAQKTCKAFDSENTILNCEFELVRSLAKGGEYSAAMKTASKMKDQGSEDSACMDIARIAYEQNAFAQVKGLMKQVKSPHAMGNILKYQSLYLATEGKYDEAIKVVGKIEVDWMKEKASSELAFLLAEKGAYEKAHEVAPWPDLNNPPSSKKAGILEALGSMNTKDPDGGGTSTIEQIRLETLTKNGEVESVMKEVTSSSYGYDRGWAMRIIARALVEMDRMQEALEYVLQINNPNAVNAGLVEIAHLMASGGSLGWGLLAALSVVETEKDWGSHEKAVDSFFRGMGEDPPADKLPLQIAYPELGGELACLVNSSAC